MRGKIAGGKNIEKAIAAKNSRIHFPTHLHD